MRNKIGAAALFPVVTGTAAFFLRMLELKSVFDPETGLARRLAPVTILLVVLGLTAAAVSIALAAVSLKGVQSPSGYDRAFRPDGLGKVILWIASGALCAGGAFYTVVNFQGGYGGIILGVLAVLTGVSCLMTTRSAVRGTAGAELYLYGIIPPVFFCAWLLSVYRANITNPVLLRFCWPCIALGLMALSWYYDAGYIFRREHPRTCVACNMLAVHFGIMALADAASPAAAVIIACAVIHRVISCRALLLNSAAAG